MIWVYAAIYMLGVLLLLHRPFWPYVSADMEEAMVVISEQFGEAEPKDQHSAMLAHHVGWVLNAILWPLTLPRNVYNWWVAR